MSGLIQCDLSELISRGIYTDEDAIAHIKSANDYAVKSALDVPAIAQLFANPVLAPLAERHGFVSFSPGGPRNLYKKLLYEQQLQDKLRASQMAAQSDRGTYMDTIRGLAAITGQEWTPERAAAAEQLSGQIANVSPMLMQLNPGLFERLHGRRGSAALMASRMMDTAQHLGTNPEHAAAVSSIVTRNLSQNPAWANGLSAGEIGDLYKQMYMRGMIPANDPFAASEALENMSAPAAVLKELGGRGSLDELDAMAPGMLSQLPPRELASRLREQNILSQSPSLYGASGGKHRNLMAGAANSRMANQIGATLRLGSVGGFKVDPKAIADMDTGQWFDYMERQGIDPSQARAALSATPANKEFIYRRNVAPLVYSKQREEIGGNLSRYFGKDVGGAIMDMPRDVMLNGRKRNKALAKALGVSPIEAETLWGRANTMMSRGYGMDAWDVNKLYNSGTMDLSRRFRDDASNRANLESYYAGYLPNNPTQAFFESLQTAGPDTGLGEIVGRTLGMVPIEEIPPIPPMPNIFGDKQSGDVRPSVRFSLPYEGGHLLQMAQDPKWKGKVRHAGGGIEEGETPEETALREFEEEFGQKLRPEQLKYLGKDTNPEFPHSFYEVLDHGLSPKTYQASNDPDEIVKLVKALMDDKYLGPDMDKLSGDMKDLLSQVNAELMGSRGRARKYGRPEPEDSDHDYVAFSDDADEQAKYLKLLRQLGTSGYKLHDRPGGFLTASGDNTDLSVYPTSKRDDIHKAWELIEGGMSKDEAWEQVEKEADSGIKQRIEDASNPDRFLPQQIPINPNWFLPPPQLMPPPPAPPAVRKAIKALPNIEELLKGLDDEFAPKATPPPHPKELSPPNMLPNIPTKGGIPSAKVAELTDLLKGVTDTMALVSVQKETIDKRHAEQEENRKLLKAVQRNERERKARRIAASQDKMNVMMGKVGDHEGWRVAKSDIAGNGIFSTTEFNPEDFITKAIDVVEKSDKYPWKPEYKQTDACRYTNHTRKPNAKLVRDGDVLNIVALEKIPNGVEITVNYVQANQEMGSGFHYTHNGEEYKTDDGIEDIVSRDMLLDLAEKLSNDKKKKRKKKKQHT